MSKDMYKPSGELQGDDKPFKERSTGAGVSDTYGADIGGDATNDAGKIRGTGSDRGELARGSAEKA